MIFRPRHHLLAAVVLLLLLIITLAAASAATTAHAHNTKTRGSTCVHGHSAFASQKLYIADGSDPADFDIETYVTARLEQQQQEQQADNLEGDGQQQQQRTANELATTAATIWRRIGIEFNMSLVDYPHYDVDVTTGQPYACSAANSVVFAGGRDSGVDCFDAAGVRRFQNYCRLQCQANETVNSTARTRLRSELDKVAVYLQQQLEVLKRDNSTVHVTSTSQRDCGGMSLDYYAQGRDLFVAVTARPTRQLGNSVDAYALSCQVHEGSNRPVLIHLNINPTSIYDPAVNLFDEILHQMFHGLGFANASYPLYLYPQGNRTQTYYNYSQSSFPTGPISGAGVSQVTDPISGKVTSFILEEWKINPGDKLFFRGPNVARVAENYFGCGNVISTLGGVELENGGGSGTVTGVHWEKRLLFQELLLGTPAPQQYISLFSWALLQDAGFYNVPALESQNYWDTSLMNFGRGKGCSWASGKCSAWDSDYFCTGAGQATCGFDRSFIAQCDLQTWVSPVSAAYRYFPSDSRLAGPDALADLCPINRLIEFGECGNNNNAYALSGDRTTKQGMAFQQSSRCFFNRLISSSFSQPGGSVLTGCYQSFCSNSNATTGLLNAPAYVVVGRETVPCTKDNDIIELFPPPRYNTGNFSLTTPGATLQYSYSYHGMLRCDSLVSYCKKPNITIPTITVQMPAVTEIVPPWGDPTGGGSVTVLGERLTRCARVTIGGAVLRDMVVVNDSAIRGILSNVGQGGGGPNPDGTGDAIVELQCYLSQVPYCNSNRGCIVARTSGVFNYSFVDPDLLAVQKTGVLSDFFDSAAGKAVGVIMAVVVIIILMILARVLFKDGHKGLEDTAKKDEKKDGDEEEDDDEDGGAGANNNSNLITTPSGNQVPADSTTTDPTAVPLMSPTNGGDSSSGAAVPANGADDEEMVVLI